MSTKTFGRNVRRWWPPMRARHIVPAVFTLTCIGLLWSGGCRPSGKAPSPPPSPAPATSSVPAPQPAQTAETPPPPTLERLGTTPIGFAEVVRVGGFPLLWTKHIFPVDQQGKLPAGDDPVVQLTAQVGQLLSNVESLLTENGSGWDKLVRVHGYVVKAEVADSLIKALAERIPAEARPALTLVETPLPIEGAQLAVDVVAVTSAEVQKLTLRRSESIFGEEGFADVALVPVGRLAFFSGNPERGEPDAAVGKSMAGLLETGQQLAITRPDIAQLKAFVQPIGLASTVKAELRKTFADQLVPPLVLAEWIASAPVEIEMITTVPSAEALSGQKLRFYNPPGVKASPTFTRVVLAAPGILAFTSGLVAEEAADGAGEVESLFTRLGKILESVKSDFRQLVKATYYVSGKEASAALDKLRPKYFDPACPPAASKVTVHGVARPGRTITMDMVILAAP